MTLEEAKEKFLGMPVRTPAAGVIKIKKLRQLKDGRILAYNDHNWVINIDCVRFVNGDSIDK